MPLYLVTAPPAEPITTDETKEHLRVDDNDNDDYIDALIKTARQRIDGRDGLLGRALVRQTWDWKFDRFDRRDPEGCRPELRRDRALSIREPTWRLEIPLPPLQSVTSVKYLDTNNVEQTLDPASYVVTGADGWQRAQIEPAQGAPWPSVLCVPEAIRIRMVCGYRPDSDSVPKDYTLNIPVPIKLAMKMMLAAWYENRDSLGVMPASALDLLNGYRVSWPF